MSHSIRRLPLRALCATLTLLALAGATAAPALAATVIHFQRESYEALLGQLRKGEVHAIVLHPQGYKAHVSLGDGGHMTVTYKPSEVSQLEAQARAKGASFAVATSTHKTAAAHHKLRYIAGAIVIVVIVVVLAVLLVGRRRALVEEEDAGSASGGEAAATPPGAGAS
jgi:flagellar biosynthesis/type III secretory pathway M-ring protein FliF/YscJ